MICCFMCNRDISNNLYRCCDHNTCSKYCSDKLFAINIKRDPTFSNHNIWLKDASDYYIKHQVITTVKPDVKIDIYPNISYIEPDLHKYYFDNTKINISNNVSNNTCYYITSIIPNNYYYITYLYTSVMKLVSSISSEIDNLYKKKKKKLY